MERYDALNRFHAWYEHWHRYHWIGPHLNHKTVADLACGEGYGSALLSHHAKQVWAFDIDQETIQQAKEKYQHLGGVIFNTANVLDTPIKDNNMDAVVSFETLEHLAEHEELLTEFKRILKKNGLLVISTPDKNVYSATDAHHNEFHVKELAAEEFQELMNRNFKHVLYFGQQFQANSLISLQPQIQEHDSNTQALLVAQGKEFKYAKNQQLPTYLIAVASNDSAAIESFRQLPASTFNDANNSLFNHYEAQVERMMLADQRLAELEQQLTKQSAVITQLQARLGL